MEHAEEACVLSHRVVIVQLMSLEVVTVTVEVMSLGVIIALELVSQTI